MSFLGIKMFSSLPSVIPDNLIEVRGQKIGLAESFVKYINQNPSSLHIANIRQLCWMQGILMKAEVDVEQPLFAKINEVFKSSQIAQGYFKKSSPKTQVKEELSVMNNVHNGLNDIAAISKAFKQCLSIDSMTIKIFSQGELNLRQTKQFIHEYGSQLEEMTLSQVDEELLKLIKANCVLLNSFIFAENFYTDQSAFTDSCLDWIGQLPNLTTLKIDGWDAYIITTEAFQRLLKQPHLQNNLRVLSLTSFVVDGNAVKGISQFKQLEQLSLNCTLSFKDIDPVLQSPFLKASLKSLKLKLNGDCEIALSNPIIYSLSQYKLTELDLAVKWQVHDQNFQNFLNLQKSLAKLSLTGFPITTGMAEKIAEFDQLEELSLGNCSSFSDKDYEKILASKNNLRVLKLTQAEHLSDFTLTILAKLQLTTLALSDCHFYGSYNGESLKTLCDSEILQKNLRSFSLANNNVVSSWDLGNISKFSHLEILNISNCSKFNDASIQQFLESSIRTSLKHLGLTKISISDAQIGSLAQFKKLESLMISSCGALTKEGVQILLRSETLRQNLKRFYLENIVITDDMVPKFELFKALELLILGNIDELKNEDQFFKLKNLIGKEIDIFSGVTDTAFEDFIKG